MGGTNVRYSAEGNFANNQHITGTLRMGADPKTSVCDSFGRPTIMKTCSFAAPGVMPTAATMNSTLTGVALALRYRASHTARSHHYSRIAPGPHRSSKCEADLQ